MSNVSQSLEANKNYISKVLHYPTSNDVQISDIDIWLNSNTIKSFFVSYDGLVNTDLINNYIIRPLMNKSNTYEFPSSEKKSFLKKKTISDDKNLINALKSSILQDLQITPSSDFDEIIACILHGDSALFIEGHDTALICDTKNIPGRSVTKSEIEMNLKGPAEAFVENFRTNTALIRKFVKDKNLIFES